GHASLLEKSRAKVQRKRGAGACLLEPNIAVELDCREVTLSLLHMLAAIYEKMADSVADTAASVAAPPGSSAPAAPDVLKAARHVDSRFRAQFIDRVA